MSSLLEEAIVDAKALKEAALKNAENAVLEKYSVEVKGALSTLLEQDEFGLGLEEDAPADASFTDDVPYAFQTEELDSPPQDELIEIDFNALKARIDEEEAAGVETSPDSLIDATDLAADLGTPPAGVVPELTESDDDSPDITEKTNLEEDEDIALTEEMIADLIEELVSEKVEYQGTPRPQGWASVNSADNSVEQANNNAMAAAQAAQLDEDEEELEEDASTAPDVVSDAALYESKISELTESLKGLYALLTESKTQLTRLNLENAKLVYQNKALSSTSLNERQRNKIVEAVQLANSVEEAQVLFETIQNAVGVAGSESKRPQTLREAVQRPVSLLINSKKNNQATKDPNMDRMLRLAGLTKQ